MQLLREVEERSFSLDILAVVVGREVRARRARDRKPPPEGESRRSDTMRWCRGW